MTEPLTSTLNVCHQCGRTLTLTRINLDIVFTSKTQAEGNKVFCSFACLRNFIDGATD